jgi:predicted metal-dependent hydrolase
VLTVSGIPVTVVRKAIKNLHLGVYPPDGRVRVAAPLAVSDAAVRVAVIGKLRWIRQQQSAFERQPREPAREMVSGESHYFQGRSCRLQVVETNGKCGVVLRRKGVIELHARPNQPTAHRERILWRWYREQLQELVPPLIAKWEPRLGVNLSAWAARKMRTKWGTCNATTRRILLNRELVKKPHECLEYIVVHELVHLIVRKHDERFFALMDKHLPRWRGIRQRLNGEPLGGER